MNHTRRRLALFVALGSFVLAALAALEVKQHLDRRFTGSWVLEKGGDARTLLHIGDKLIEVVTEGDTSPIRMTIADPKIVYPTLTFRMTETSANGLYSFITIVTARIDGDELIVDRYLDDGTHFDKNLIFRRVTDTGRHNAKPYP